MRQINERNEKSSKCSLTSCLVQPLNSKDQHSSKKRPFSNILSYPWFHTMKILVSESRANNVRQILFEKPEDLQYARVQMKLSDLIEGDFFSDYIKAGNIIMQSRGRPGLDHVFTVREGILRLEVDKATYERLGLQGSAISNYGRKHVDAYYAIELNLRLPSMVRGRKEFERIRSAFQRVLFDPLIWLFRNVKAPGDWSGPISTHQPIVRTIKPETSSIKSVIIPNRPPAANFNDADMFAELLEWSTLAIDASSRVSADDQIDPFLSRYEVQPRNSPSPSADQPRLDMAVLGCHGFLQALTVFQIFASILEVAQNDIWVMKCECFDGRSLTILQNEFRSLVWEYGE